MSSTPLSFRVSRPDHRSALVGLTLLGTILALVVGVPHPAAAAEIGFEAHRYDIGGAEMGSAITGEKPESKLWFHDGVWWAAMVSAAGTGEHTIHRLDGTVWTDTGIALDATPKGREDVLSDGATLYVLTREAWTLNRYTYTGNGAADGDGTYVLDAGFPVSLPISDAETLTLARDTTGSLWIAWEAHGRALLMRTYGDDLHFSPPFTVPVPEALGLSDDDIAAVTAFTDATGPAIGVMWSHQPKDAQYFAVHRDGAPDDAWTVETALSGPREADDHISLKTFEQRVFAVVKTGMTNVGEPLIRLVVRAPNGSWTTRPVALVEGSDTRPITVLEVDPASRRLYVFMTRNPADGARHIVYKSTSIDAVDFSGEAIPFIRGSKGINNATSMKANANAASGVVILASSSRNYWWNRLGGGGAPPPPPPGSYTLTVDTVGSGTVALDPPGGTYEEGTRVTLTASPESGWSFSGWSGDLSGSANPETIVMDADRSVTATFTEDEPPPPPPPGDGITSLQTVTAGASATATIDSPPLDPGTDQLYVTTVVTKNQKPVDTVTGLGLSWNRRAAQCSGRNQTAVEVWTATGSPTTAGPVTATLTAATNNVIIAVTRYQGADPTAPIAATVSANTNGTDGACSGGSDTAGYSLPVPTQAGQVVHTAIAMRNKTHTPGAGFTELIETSQGSGGRTAGAALTQHPDPPDGTLTADGTFSGTVDWAVAAVVLVTA